MTKRRRVWALTLLAVALLAGVACYVWGHSEHHLGSGGPFSEVEEVSLINLIATPERYNGKWVRVMGVCNFEFEGNGLFLSQEDRKHGFCKNAIWACYDTLGAQPYDLAFWSRFHGRCVLVEGHFDARSTGHMGLFSGALTNVNRIMTWPW